MSAVTLFGIRHHGPGSARSLRRALATLQPDLVLVEGPPDADAVLPLLTHADMHPPTALLVYVPETPQQAVFFPFAAFSPEWQAIHYALTHTIPVALCDLPQAHQFALEPSLPADEPEADHTPASDTAILLHPAHDPLGWLAHAAGYSDGERWWEQMIEQRRDDGDLFAAILEAMHALRAEAAQVAPLAYREALREAWMRQRIRRALGEGFQRIAVVCGAWHAPALTDLSGAQEDTALLKGLPKVKTAATWTPWSYGRLAARSGYGAGVAAPGWYDHLWRHPHEPVIPWLVHVARLLRSEDLDASSAHVIEAVRLSEALAALRGHPVPGLPELNEATQAIFCFGSPAPMRLIEEQLLISDRLGSIPAETPLVPLQQDLLALQRRLRLPPTAQWKDHDFDLRKPTDLARSYLLRRLNLLGIGWGMLQDAGGTGTFRERWRLEWQPEFAVAIIEAAIWGNTVHDAATACALARAERAADLPTLVAIVNQVLFADLPTAVAPLMAILQERSARTGDVDQLIAALVVEDRATRTSLVQSLRYGNVRNTDQTLIREVIDGLVVRICIGLPVACASLNDDAAELMFTRIVACNTALRLLQHAEHLATWHTALRQVADLRGVHGLIAGRCCRILLDAGALTADAVGQRLSIALSTAVEPIRAAAWIEGLLKESGLILLHDATLWAILDTWMADLAPEQFRQLLPLLRRTFATFPVGERQLLGERARTPAREQHAASGTSNESADIDQARADAVLPLLTQILAIQTDKNEAA